MKFIFFVLCLYMSLSKEPNPSNLELAFEAIDTIVKNDLIEGFTSAEIGVVKDGKLIHQNGWGKLNSYYQNGTARTDGPEVTNDTLYDLASNTKMYSSIYAIQYLSEHPLNGKLLDIDQKLVDFFGQSFVDDTLDIKMSSTKLDIKDVKYYKSQITIRDILCHRAGFPSSPNYHWKYYDYEKQTKNTTVLNVLYPGKPGLPETRENTLNCIFKTPVIYQYRSQVLYSDADFMICTYIIEHYTGMKFNDYLRETFWIPMGIDHITFNPLENGFTKEDCAATELNGNSRDHHIDFPDNRNYTIQGEVHDEKAFYCMNGCSGHAGLYASASQLAKLAYLMVDGNYTGVPIFSKETIEFFSTNDNPNVTNWGIGWYRMGKKERTGLWGTLAPETTIGHQGWTGTCTLIDRENKIVIAFLTNKINSPVTSDENPDKFNGNWFTTAQLYFANQLIYEALLSTSESEAKQRIINATNQFVVDRFNDLKNVKDPSIDHPAVKAFMSISRSQEEIKKRLNP